ncbi:MAG: L-aspartate oxidase [Rhodospirillales bacterium]|nr:L-aspartate oxidase [Rhodospirillales bacterium]
MPDAYREHFVQHWRSSVVIVGSGVAGLACALALAPAPVLLLTKTPAAPSGSSALAQGGIAAAVGLGDTAESHAADTVAAGAGLVDEARALLLAREGAQAVRSLIDAGVPFDRAPDGRIVLGREAAHSIDRIVHAGGDATGRNLVGALLAMIAATPSVRIVTDCFVTDLVGNGERVTGLTAFHAHDGWVQVHANHVVLATGGTGNLWRATTNPVEATGDGLALAARAGARLADIEFVQFHPTALLPAGAGGGSRLPLLTEALRGAGALLLDEHGHRFMPDEHPLAELAPRDVVARAIARRTASGHPVMLDMRPALAAKGEKSFPQGLALCREAGYEPCERPVPVVPAAHYHMGGVVTDEHGRTGVAGLWACGEVAMTGVHGANRLASNSLLEGLVFGHRVAGDIRASARTSSPAVDSARGTPVIAALPQAELEAMRSELRALMTEHVGIVRTGDGLAVASSGLAALQARLAALQAEALADGPADFAGLRRAGELDNMLTVARLLVTAALRRTESRGAHFRADHPEAGADWERRQVLTMADIENDRVRDRARVVAP